MHTYEIPKTAWRHKLGAILKDKALQAFLSVSMTDASSYDKIKTAILLRTGVYPTNTFQTFLNFQPEPSTTATHYFGIAMGILNSLDAKLTHEQFKEKLALEFTYSAAAPLITLFVRALRLSSPTSWICHRTWPVRSYKRNGAWTPMEV